MERERGEREGGRDQKVGIKPCTLHAHVAQSTTRRALL